MTTTYCVEYASLFRQKMHDRFRILTLKRPLPERSEAKKIFLVPTDAAQNPIIGPDLSEPSAYLPPRCGTLLVISAKSEHWREDAWTNRSPSGFSIDML